jgi:hypothetical protein
VREPSATPQHPEDTVLSRTKSNVVTPSKSNVVATTFQQRSVTPLPLADRGGEHVGDEEADGLRPLILVGACGAFAAVLRNHAEIVLAQVDGQSPEVRGAPALVGPLFARPTSPCVFPPWRG